MAISIYEHLVIFIIGGNNEERFVIPTATEIEFNSHSNLVYVNNIPKELRMNNCYISLNLLIFLSIIIFSCRRHIYLL